MKTELYFANLAVEIIGEKAYRIPEEWEIFLKESSYRRKISLEVSEEEILIPESAALRVGDSRVCEYGDGWLFLQAVENPGERERMRRFLRGEFQTPPDLKEKEENTAKARENAHPMCRGALWMSQKYDRGICYLEKGKTSLTLPGLRVAMDAILPDCGGSVIHASCIVHRGEGVLFLGPSGMGKSTQAGLWMETCGCHMLSSDAPAVYPGKMGAMVCGMPWDGSDHVISREQVPVRAFVFLSQEKENCIEKLDARRSFEGLLKQGHLPLWDQTQMEKELFVLKQLAQKIPMYHLGCRPEAEAVDLTCQAIFG